MRSPAQSDELSATDPTPVVLFDRDCPLCRSLAEWGRARAEGRVEFHPWQEWRASPLALEILGEGAPVMPADTLRVLTEKRLWSGQEAWEIVLSAHPDLRSLQWVAERLGLARVASAALATGGAVARKFCYHCHFMR